MVKIIAQLTKINNDKLFYNNNISKMFYKDYADNLALLTNDITGEKINYNLDTILNSEKRILTK